MEIQFKYLNITFKGVAKSQQDVFRKVAFWSSLPTKCTACNSTNVRPDHRTPKDYEFYSIRCCDCGAECKIGERKDNKGMFFREDEKFEKFSGDGEKRTSEGNQERSAPEEEDDDF